MPDVATVTQSASEGRATAITVMTPIRPPHTIGLRAVFFLGSHIKTLNEALVKLSFIHYARWSIITDIPYNGEPQKREKLHYDYLFFETNFNGTWDEYIDAFSEVVPDRMKAIWGSSFGFPGPRPVGPFKAYIHANELPVAHYYGAYPEAATKMVNGSLRVQDAVTRFAADTEDITDPAEFREAYLRFLTEVQHDL